MCQNHEQEEAWSWGERIESLRYHQSKFVSGNLSSGLVAERQNDKQIVGWKKKNNVKCRKKTKIVVTNNIRPNYQGIKTV